MTMLFEVEALPIPRPLREAAKQAGVSISSKEDPKPDNYAEQRKQEDRIRAECTKWAWGQSNHIPAPRKYPGLAICLVGVIMFLSASSFSGGATFIYYVASIIIAFTGANIIHTNTMGVKSGNSLQARKEKTLSTLAEITYKNAIRNLPTPPRATPPTDNIVQEKFPIPQDGSRISNSTATQAQPLPSGSYLSPRPIQANNSVATKRALDHLGISNHSYILPNLRLNQLSPLKKNPPQYLIYVNTQKRKMDVERYISFVSMNNFLGTVGLVFSHNGFTGNLITYAESSDGILISLALDGDDVSPVTTQAQGLLNQLLGPSTGICT